MYVSAASVGIAALVAAGSLRHNLEEALRRQAKPLLGADLSIRSRRAFDADAERLFASVPHEKLREIELTTVAYFPSKAGSRLIEVRGIEKGFPFYGDIKTEPAGGINAIFDGPVIFVEENVLVEFGLASGDEVDLGNGKLTIGGAIKIAPGEAMASVFSAPRAFVSLDQLRKTGLLSGASLARHKTYFKIPDDTALKKIESQIGPVAKKTGWSVSTVEERRRSLGRRAENASKFLEIAALTALLLGAIGVASILYVYAKGKRETMATLKCLGAPARDAFLIFATQGVSIGIAGSLMGIALGIALQAGLPLALKQLVLVEIPFSLSWPSICKGLAVGFGVTVAFSLLPLLGLRSVSPLSAIRAEFEPPKRARWSWPRPRAPLWWPAPLRHGFANMFRPNNQTPVLIAALGFGSALIFTIAFLNDSLLRHISLSASGEEPTLALIDIQTYQRDDVRELLKREGASVADEAPFVSMRIQKLKGVPAAEAKMDVGRERPDWALRREYRSTYRATLGASETLAKGSWPPPAFNPAGPVPISIENGIADDLHVGIGDAITFDVQGVPMDTVIVALRNVDWFQLRPNFFVVFPPSVLEEAPQFTVMLAKTDTVERTAAVQRALREQFPTVSTVDLRMVLETLNSYFDKVALALKFMALFVVLTGLMILAGALVSGRQERLREAAVLRTLGASAWHLRFIHLLEYGFIGFFSALAGLALGAGASLYVTKQVFEIGFRPGLSPAINGMAGMIAICVVTGLFLGRGLLHRRPLETLRDE